MRFDDLKLMPLLLQNVQAAGYETPTPIQQATIPLVLAGKDVLGCAQTGTGKTAAFALPIIQQLAKKPTRFGQNRAIRALILTPTRELAQQIYDNFVLYGKKLPVYPTVIFGGVNQQGQVNALHRGADVVIACPGRLWDLMNQGFVHLDKVETFVLDEADLHPRRAPHCGKAAGKAPDADVLRDDAAGGRKAGDGSAPRAGIRQG